MKVDSADGQGYLQGGQCTWTAQTVQGNNTGVPCKGLKLEVDVSHNQ